ncbi:MAG: M1 family metallopeptidase [Myxococcota bacterium]|nr:M1 family metallopeptidase [Myxococcota bacterium]
MTGTWFIWAGLGLANGAPAALVPDGLDRDVPRRHFDIVALHLDLALDIPNRGIGGTAKYTLERLGDGDFVLDQVALDIESVSVDGEAALHRTPGNKLIIEMPKRIVRGGQADVTIRYSARPRKGLHFRERRAPDKYAEVWTQGQKNDNRYWFPAWDHPNDRFEYTGSVSGPDDWKITTNSGNNVPSYLIMIAGGPYKEVGGPNNRVWVGPDTPMAAIENVWKPVPDMMEHFTERTGVAYPWSEYLQVFVQRFMYGGMENTAATINTDAVLTTDDVLQTQDFIQSLVAHELAHQWYGDYLTCRSWRDLWLNEGFATFFAADWMARRDGPERWAHSMLRYQRWSQYEESLAGRFFHGEDAPDNANVYSKGATVLQMLRVMLGEAVFWEGIRHYTKTHARSLVRTHDLQESMEAVSGRELGWFFQQWVELPHVPRVTVSTRWADGVLTVTVRQKTSEERPRYTIPFEVEIGGDGGGIHAAVLRDEKLQIQIPLETAPPYVAFDPKAGVLAELEYEQEPEAWTAQLQSDSPAAVFRAIEALSETDHSEPLAALLADTTAHPLVRSEAAEALGEQRRTDLLLAHADDGHARVRRAVILALGRGTDGTAMTVLERAFIGDRNPDVRAAALDSIESLAKTRSVTLARSAVRSSNAAIANTGARVLGKHGELADIDSLRSMRMRRSTRMGGMRAAAKIVRRLHDQSGSDRAAEQLTGTLVGLLTDLDIRARQAAVRLLDEVGTNSAIADLEAFRREETVASLSRSAREAIDSIRERQGKIEPIAGENKAEAALQSLEERIDELESQFGEWKDSH